MLSITKCKKILNTNGFFYTDEEILMIRNTLYKLAEVYHKYLQKDTRSISSNKNSTINIHTKTKIIGK